MKLSHHLFILLSTVTMLAICGCDRSQDPVGSAGLTGPAGSTDLAEVDGKDGQEGNLTHPETRTTGTIDLVRLQFLRSGHAMGAAVDYAGWRAMCARCHSNEGFVEYAENGFIEDDIPDPTPINCNTCHNLHQTLEYADYTFRIDPADPVPAIFDGALSFDFGDSSNLCANCHQSRRAEPNISHPGETFEITSPYYGPHHGAQANVFQGLGFAEIAGSQPFGVANPHAVAAATCVTCHMADCTDGTGGHTWRPCENACNNCHGGGFAYNGVQAENEERLISLRDLLVDAGVMEYVDNTYEVVLGTYPMIQAQAFFNWIGLEEDRSLGVHNPSYVKALLVNSIEALQTTRNQVPRQDVPGD